MSTPTSGTPTPDEGAEGTARPEPDRPEPDWQRRRRLAEVFGDGVPEQTTDDRDAREDTTGKGDDWYREQVPPHHG